MGMFGTCTLLIIFYQCVFITTLSWWTLNCNFTPEHTELQQVTLMKLLYLYDPEACGIVRFFNVTVYTHHDTAISTIMWPTKNKIAAHFRKKLKISLALHLIWFALGAAYVSYGARYCSFYVVLVPFTLAGLAVLLMDCLFTASFLKDVYYTTTELSIISYILLGETSRLPLQASSRVEEDTSWIALLFAYLSCRGVVQWMLNFWLVQDNFLRGLSVYRVMKKEEQKKRQRLRSLN